jgi:hypothetical protein
LMSTAINTPLVAVTEPQVAARLLAVPVSMIVSLSAMPRQDAMVFPSVVSATIS